MVKEIERYNLFNGLAITSCLSRIQDLVEGEDLQDFFEDMSLQDDDREGFISYDNVLKSWKLS